MKKLLLLAAALLFISCSKDDKDTELIDPTCECLKQTWVRQTNPTVTAWSFNGATEFYSNDCDDDGKIFPGNSGQGIEFQYRIKCD
jgi:hypothetical protein